VGTAGDIETKK